MRFTSTRAGFGGRIGAQKTDHATLPYGRKPAAVLVGVNIIDGLDWGVLIGVLPLLQDDGVIATAATLAGLTMVLPAGWITDHLPRARVLALVVATWALFQGAGAVAVGFWMFFATRVLLGVSVQIDNPLAASLMADYYPPAVRGRVFGLQRVAHTVGTALGIGIGGAVGEALGWRWAFGFTIIPSLGLAITCLALREPPRGELDRGAPHDVSVLEEMELGTPEEEHLERGARAYLRRVRETMQIPSARTLFVGVTVAFMGFNGIAYWLPEFWERTHDVSASAASGAAAIIALFGAVGGSILGGVLGDRWSHDRPRRRVDLLFAGLLGGSVVLLASLLLPSFALQALVLGVAVFLMVLSYPNFTAATADILPAGRRGTGFAVFTLLVTAGSALGPLLVGAVSDLSGSLTLAMAMAVVPVIPGAFVARRACRTIAADIEAARAGPEA